MSNKIVDGIMKDIKGIPKKFIQKGKGDPKKLILMNLPYVLAGYFADKVSYVYRTAPGSDMSSKMTSVIAGLSTQGSLAMGKCEMVYISMRRGWHFALSWHPSHFYRTDDNQIGGKLWQGRTEVSRFMA